MVLLYYCAFPSSEKNSYGADKELTSIISAGPAFFQAAKASTVIASAVNFLPVVCFISPAAMATGLTINRFQHYKLQNIVGWGTSPAPFFMFRHSTDLLRIKFCSPSVSVCLF